MFAVRSAILVVALSFVISPIPVSASCSSPSAAGRVSLSHAGESSIVDRDVAPVTEAPKVSPRASRRPRLKAVLEEETDRKPEEIDLGTMPVPRMPGLHTSISISSPFNPRTSRLRC